MGYFHDDSDSIDQLKQDAGDSGHTPDSVRESAIEELAKRGYSQQEITEIRLNN